MPRLLAVFIVVCIVRLMSLDLHRKNKEKPSKFNLPWKKLEKKMSKKSEEGNEGKTSRGKLRTRNMQII